MEAHLESPSMARRSVEAKSSTVFDHSTMAIAKIANGFSPRQYPINSGDTILDGDGDSIMNTNHDSADLQGFRGLKQDIHVNADHNCSPDRSSNSPGTISASSQHALEILGQGMKEMVQTVQKLRHLGVEDLVLPLPKIVVVGDQSTGKSSLIEGMSGIKVPRKAGTCTRCPLEIELNDKPDTPWSCKVSLYKKYVYNSTTMRSARSLGATKQRPLGPWTAQDPETFPFFEARTKSEVPGIIERAQLAILNPHVEYEDYLPNALTDPPSKCQVKFSPNVIRLKISGPGLPNLAFHDLPGVINVSDNAEEEYLVQLVKNLVTEYIKEETCINLLALPMSDDPANSSALRLIGEVGAKDRTIGVLTKPDRIQQCEDMQQWIQILNGERFELGHAYFVVKNNADTNVDHETARAEEKRFFDQEQLWASDLRKHSRRFGTFQLQNALSQVLTVRIQKSLPSIIDRVQSKAEQIDSRLLELPEPPQGNLPMQLVQQILRFGYAIRLSIDGDQDTYPFQKHWAHLMRQFRKTMSDSRPILRPLVTIKRSVEDQQQPSTPTPHRRPTIPIVVESDDETGGSPYKTPNKRSAAVQQTSSAKKLKLNDIPLHSPSVGLSQAASPTYSRNFTFAEVRQYLQDAQTIGLSGQNPKATERMAKECCQLWDKPLEMFLESTDQLCRETILSHAEAAFEQWRQTPLQATIHATCNKYLNDIMSRQRESTMVILRRECIKPMALNEEALNAAYEKVFKIIAAWRRERRIEEKQMEQDAESGETPSRQGRAPTKFSDEQLGPDPYGQELGAMVRLKAWYEVSSARFVDNVCQAICCELFLECRTGLELALREEIGLEKDDAHARCALLLAINPKDARERIQLQKEKETLRKAQMHLQGFSHQVKGE